jgi:hypothetical protein
MEGRDAGREDADAMTSWRACACEDIVIEQVDADADALVDEITLPAGTLAATLEQEFEAHARDG